MPLGGNGTPRYISTPHGVKKYVNVGAGKDDRGREKYSLQGIDLFLNTVKWGKRAGWNQSKESKVPSPTLPAFPLLT
jgi:hypothetical protein